MHELGDGVESRELTASTSASVYRRFSASSMAGSILGQVDERPVPDQTEEFVAEQHRLCHDSSRPGPNVP